MIKKFLTIFFTIFALTNNSSFGASTNEIINVKGTDFDGKIFDLEKENKVILINFWASWCSICLGEIPILNELQEKYGSNDFEVIGININDKKYKENVIKFVKKNLNYRNIQIDDLEINNLNYPESIPLNFLISKNNKLVRIIDETEDFDKEELEELIEEELGL
jgi:thiol-disulfide isomerase/thioredoxin